MPPGTDSDLQVALLLGRLADAAEPLAPHELDRMTAFAIASAPRSSVASPRRHGRRGRSVAVALAAAVLMVASGASAYVLMNDSDVPDGLQTAINSVFAQQRCVGADEAITLVQEQLTGLGLSSWAVQARPGATGTRCVAAGLDLTHEQVVLIPIERPAVVEAMAAIEAHLKSACLGEDEARAFVGSVLEGLGVTNWSISTNGPVAYPIGEEDSLHAHVADGCTVWSLSGHGADGGLVIYLTPPA